MPFASQPDSKYRAAFYCRLSLREKRKNTAFAERKATLICRTLQRVVAFVVDDEPAARYALAKTLRASDRMIFKAEDGEAAPAMLIEHAPDLVFLDLNMPRKEGLNALLDLAQQQQKIAKLGICP